MQRSFVLWQKKTFQLFFEHVFGACGSPLSFPFSALVTHHSACLQDVLPGEYQLLLRHSKVYEPFSITVEAQGKILKESVKIHSTEPGYGSILAFTVEPNYEPTWEQLELGKVVISGTGLQSCHIRLHNIRSNDYKLGWILDFLELKRIA